MAHKPDVFLVKQEIFLLRLVLVKIVHKAHFLPYKVLLNVKNVDVGIKRSMIKPNVNHVHQECFLPKKDDVNNVQSIRIRLIKDRVNVSSVALELKSTHNKPNVNSANPDHSLMMMACVKLVK